MMKSINLIKACSTPVFNTDELNLSCKAESIFNFFVVFETSLEENFIQLTFNSSYFFFQIGTPVG